MKEEEIKNIINKGIKSPSDNFTDNVMNGITKLENKLDRTYHFKTRLLIVSCSLLLVASVFVRIPDLQILNFTFKFSPVIMPVLSLIFSFIILQQLFDIKNKFIKSENNKSAQHSI